MLSLMTIMVLLFIGRGESEGEERKKEMVFNIFFNGRGQRRMLGGLFSVTHMHQAFQTLEAHATAGSRVRTLL